MCMCLPGKSSCSFHWERQDFVSGGLPLHSSKWKSRSGLATTPVICHLCLRQDWVGLGATVDGAVSQLDGHSLDSAQSTTRFFLAGN